MSIIKRELLGDDTRQFLRDPVTEESVWRRSAMLTMIREYDGRGTVLVQSDNGMPPIRLRTNGDSCEMTMRFTVGGAEVVPIRVWITTTNPQFGPQRPIRNRLRRLGLSLVRKKKRM